MQPLCASQCPDPLHQLHIPTKIRLLETGHVAPPIIFGKLIEARDLGSQKPPAERTVSDKADAKLANGIEQSSFGVATSE